MILGVPFNSNTRQVEFENMYSELQADLLLTYFMSNFCRFLNSMHIK